MNGDDFIFSIIIPMYNAEKTIKRCLESIIKQNFSQYEIILINDESTDNSLSIAKGLLEKTDLNFQIFDIKNTHLGPERNLGMQHATNEYIWFIDADDYLTNDHVFERVANDINKYHPDVYIFSVLETNFENRNKVWHFAKKEGLTSIKERPLLYLNQNWLWNKPFKRSLLEEGNLTFQNIMFEDMYFLAKLYPLTKTIYISRDVNYVYVKHDGAMTAKPKNFIKYPIALLNSGLAAIKTIIKK